MRENRTSSIDPKALRATSAGEPLVELGNDRQRQALELLEQGLENILSDENFAEYLRVMGRFHTYSFANTLLIHQQYPRATKVMGYGNKEGTSGWRSVGRQVRQGEKAIKIFAPLKRVEIDEATGERVERVRGFRLVNVFDISQTDGKPLPEPPVSEELGESAIGWEVDRRLSKWLIDDGVRCEVLPLMQGLRGFYMAARDGNPHRIVLNRFNTPGDGVTKTLAHETAHMLAEHRGQVARQDAETVAESSAFVVMSHYGIDTGSYSFSYVARWAENMDVFRTNLNEIQKVSSTLIRAIDGIPAPDEGGEHG